MVKLSVLVEGAHGLTWPRWKAIVETTERLGYTGLYGSDHFTLAPAPPDRGSLELIVALTYAADHTACVEIGQLVSPVSFRDPIMLTRQMLALDDLSEGRKVYGLGAGWNVREHALFGYDLGDVRTRMDRFTEAMAIVSLLLHGDEPVSFTGRFYTLDGATFLPRPGRAGGPPILIGGSGPKRTMPLVAQYADIWNAVMVAPDVVRERCAILDGLLVERGRPTSAVRRTLMTPVFCGDTPAELAHRAVGRHATPAFAGMSEDALLDALRAKSAIMGSADEIAARIREYEAVGIDEVMVQWFPTDDLSGLHRIAEEVMPKVG